MSTEMKMDSLKNLLRFPFRDPDWQSRFVIGIGLSLAGAFIPILPTLFVYGYVLQVMRQAIEGERVHLPEWDNWGDLGLDGLRATVVSLVYYLPGFVIMFGGMAIYMVVPFAFPLLFGFGGEDQTLSLAFPFLLLAGMAIMFLAMFVGMVVTYVGMGLLPAALGHTVVHREVSAGFRLRQIWALIRVNMVGYFAAWVIVAGLGAMLYMVVMMAYMAVFLVFLFPLVMILIMPVSFYVQLVMAALFGQTYRESVEILSAEDPFILD